MRKILFAFVAVASLAGLVAPDASAQVLSPSTYAYPMPAKAGDPAVLCTTCVSTTKNLPTWQYSLPIKRFVGRMLDSARTRDIQAPIRTLRARDVRVAPANGRLYVMFGGSRFVGWNLNTFFTSDLGKPLVQLSPTYNTTPELYLPYPTYVDADTDSAWRTITVDGQNRLGGFDWDDRGYVYLAYGPYGWGIVKDQANGFNFVTQVTDKGNLVPTNNIQVLRSGTNYYSVIMNPTGSSQSAIFDVTNASSPNFLGYVDKAPNNFEKISTDSSQGIQDDIFANVAVGTQALEIYTTSQFIGNRAPAKTITASTGIYWDVTTDGTNFYAMHGIGANQDIDIVSPAVPNDATSYRVVSTYHIPNGSNAGKLRYGGGYLTLSARDSQNIYDIRLFKITNGELKDIDLQKFFQKYYTAPPAGYAKPDANTSLFTSSVVYSTGGRDYLIFESYGMADVYELQAGDSVDISVNSAAGYGTRNPNSTTTDGPYYGDPISFSSVASTTAPMSLNWDFGNPESTDNTTTSLSGAAVTHQFSGITTATQIQTAKSVVATNATDPTITDTENVTMLVPSARVGVAGTTLLLQPNASATAMVPGDLLMDASDGSVEGHYDVWSLDNVVTTGTPTEKLPVGACGAHTLTYEAHYVPYTGAGSSIVPATSVASHFIRDVSNVSYTVAPVVAGLSIASYDATNVTFKNTSRAASSATFTTGATWTEHLQFLNASGTLILDVPATTSAVGTQDTFVVVKNQIAAASKAVLTVSIDNAMIADTTCASATSTAVSATAEMPIALPDPSITVTGCTNVGLPCTLAAASLTNASQTGWTYQWKLNTSPVATTSTYTPILSAPGTYTVELAATNAFGSATATKSLSVAAPICTGAPHDVSIIANPSCASSGTCTTSSTIQFSPYAWGYTLQTCDTYTWTFGDGSSSTLKSPSHKYASNGTYTVTLKISNSNGNASGTWKIIIGTVTPPPPPPPTCPTSAPSNIYFNLTATSGCTAANPNCKTTDTISFSPAPWGYTIQTCDEYLWRFGDGTSSTLRNPTHVYANPGTYPVTLQVSNDRGANTSPAINVVITTGGGGGSCASAPGAFNGFSYSGATSKCSGPSTPCSISESVTFNAVYFSDTQRACDVITWDFGDATGTATGKTVSHAYTRQGTFPVKMTISNSLGSMNATLNLQVGGSGGTPAPVVDFTIGNTSPAVGTAVSFSGNVTSGGPIVTWNWNFGDGTTGSGQNVSHTYTTPGAKTVSLTAANSGNSAVVSKSITVADANSFAFLLPVVTHLDNDDGSKWETDLQFFNPTPNFDPTVPMVLSFEFKGQTKTLTFDKSTDIRKDFLNYLTTEKTSGSVIVRGTGNYPPQMWTRTYIVTPSGVGTYGQLIPAIPLTSQQAAGGTIPKQYLPGVHFGPKGSASRFRTNIGLVNPSAVATSVTMGFLDKDGLPVGATFDTTIQPYSLIQVNDGTIRNSVPQIDPAKTYTVELTSSVAGLMAYASIVDNTSNDPVFVQAVSETEAASATRKVQVLPGLSHFNTPAGDSWRSDVVVYNADEHTIQFDMELLGTDGTKVAEAKSITLGGSQSLQLDDMLTTATPIPVPAGAQAGTLRLTTNIGTEFPIIYSRTYNDRAELGTFGQGIPAFSGTEGNVAVDKPAYIAGVRSNSSYYTNLGLVSASDTASTVSVKLLEPIRGTVIGEQTFTVNPGQSIIVGSANADFLHSLAPSMDEQGTLKIDVTAGGNVWAFASIIDKLTKDPEYVPATPAN